MHPLISDQARILSLVTICAALWTLESAVPLYHYGDRGLRRRLPNLGLTALLILMNVVLGVALARLAASVESERFGLLYLLGFPPWAAAIAGVSANTCT